MVRIDSPFVLRSTHEKEVTRVAARAESYKIHRDDLSARLTALQDEYSALEGLFNAMEARYDAAAIEHSFVLECFEWVEDAPLWLRGTKTPDLRKRREDLRVQARKLGILVEETPAEEQEEQSA